MKAKLLPWLVKYWLARLVGYWLLLEDQGGWHAVSLLENYYLMSSRVSPPPWNIDLTPFLPSRTQKIQNLSDTLFMSNPTQNFGELGSHPLKMYPCPKKTITQFLKKQNFISNIEVRTLWTLKYEYTVAKSKNQRRARLLVFYFCLVASDRLNRHF